jgi:hypothetical protein
MIAGLFKKLSKNLNANNNVDMAPSLAEADEILARFGWTEEVALAA